VSLGLVAVNRAQLVGMVNSNLLGLNAPAIAAVEAEYEQMWAQDVTAMSAYFSGASAVAAQLTPWQQALQSLPGLQSLAGLAGNRADASGASSAATDPLVQGFNLGLGNTGSGNVGNGNPGSNNLGGPASSQRTSNRLFNR